AGAKDGAAGGEDAGHVLEVEDARVILDQAAKALLDADDLDVEVAHRGLANAADGGIEPGAIAARGEDADALGTGEGHDGSLLNLGLLQAKFVDSPPRMFKPASGVLDFARQLSKRPFSCF